MKRLTATICLTIAVLLGSTGMSWSADFHKSGDYATALREWTPLAKQGNARAQYLLGSMCNEGLGVPQDYNAAAKWCRRAC
jgi:TPR repeat protein